MIQPGPAERGARELFRIVVSQSPALSRSRRDEAARRLLLAQRALGEYFGTPPAAMEERREISPATVPDSELSESLILVSELERLAAKFHELVDQLRSAMQPDALDAVEWRRLKSRIR